MESNEKEVISAIVLGIRKFKSKPTDKFPTVEEFTNFSCLDLEDGQSFDQVIKTSKVAEFVKSEDSLLGRNFNYPVIVFSFEWTRGKTSSFRNFVGLTISEYQAKLSSDLPSSFR